MNSSPAPAAPAQTCESSLAPPAPRQLPAAEVLARLLAAIRADSQRQPETYLRDTVVPHGGE